MREGFGGREADCCRMVSEWGSYMVRCCLAVEVEWLGEVSAGSTVSGNGPARVLEDSVKLEMGIYQSQGNLG